MPTLQEIFQEHQHDYLQRFGQSMPPWHHRAIASVVNCRTPAMGGHVQLCLDCGQREYVYHSCHSRACPACHATETRDWVLGRARELLPTRYFHVVFTVPAALREPLRRNQKALCGALIRAAAESIQTLAANPKYLGARPAVLVCLHTWGRNLSWHPHVHCLVSAGGVDSDRNWREPENPRFLAPVAAMAAVFRGRFAALARAAAPEVQLPDAALAPGAKWVVHAHPCLAGPDKVIKYLARYLHRPPITNERILEATPTTVTFNYRDTESHESKVMTVHPTEFMRNLQHVPPPNFHRIRYYGLWSPARRKDLRTAMVVLGQQRLFLVAALATFIQEEETKRQTCTVCRCSRCQSVRVMKEFRIKPCARGPPA